MKPGQLLILPDKSTLSERGTYPFWELPIVIDNRVVWSFERPKFGILLCIEPLNISAASKEEKQIERQRVKAFPASSSIVEKMRGKKILSAYEAGVLSIPNLGSTMGRSNLEMEARRQFVEERLGVPGFKFLFETKFVWLSHFFIDVVEKRKNEIR